MDDLEQEVDMEETRVDLRGMSALKAMGPDGYQANFFKGSWSLSGRDVHLFMQGIMDGGWIPAEAAATLLLLIPTETHPSTIKSFRPISLCNGIMKLVTKFIINRLKETWKMIISPVQASFIPGRQGIDNVVLCQEVLHSLRYTSSKKGGVVLKLDLEKAYDRM